jgi:hypothetical protein
VALTVSALDNNNINNINMGRSQRLLVLGFLPWIQAAALPNRTDHSNIFAHTAPADLVAAATGDGILCRIRPLDVEFSSVTTNATVVEDPMVCLTDDTVGGIPQTYLLDLGPTVVLPPAQALVRFQGVRIDAAQARLVDATAGDPTWQVVPEDDDEVEDAGHGRRKLAATTPRLVLVVRVTYRGVSPTLSATTLRGRVFGQGPEWVEHSLQSQLQACSQGLYSLKAAPQHSNMAQEGMLEISIDEAVTGGNSVLVLENLVLSRATQLLRSPFMKGLAHVLVVMPQHADIQFYGNPNYLAYGYIGGSVTVYRNYWAGTLSALAHEIGHNLRLSHSGANSDVYADMSGYMGYGINQVNGPLMCFNGQKHYAAGWYQNRTRHLFVEDLPWSGYLAFFGDVASTEANEPVILQLTLPGPKRVFLQYNLAKGINAGTRSSRDGTLWPISID